MFALRAARLFDGHRFLKGEHPLLLIDGARVAGVQTGGEAPAGVEVTDLGQVTLMPGLIDTHVHLGFDAGPDPVGRMRADDDTTLVLRMRQAAQASLAAGVTTVRDLGDRSYLAVALRDWFRQGPEIGPEVLASGPPLTVTGGHCHFMGGQADDGPSLRRGVRERATRGVDVIKVMVTGGNMTAGIDPFTPQYSAEEIAAVVEEAHRFGRRVTAHVHGVAGIEAAVEAKVDGLEHCGFWVPEGVRADQCLIDRIAEQQIEVCPTAGILPGTRPPPPPVASRIEAMTRAIGRMHRAGVVLLAGTDAGVAPAKPHGGVGHSVRGLLEAGLSVEEALAAATSAAARACGLAGTKGVLAEGADADVLVVGGDPSADPGALFDVRAVFRAGVPVPLPAQAAPAAAAS